MKRLFAVVVVCLSMGSRSVFAREFDAETGLIHMGARDYDPETARFLQEDPLGIGTPVSAYLPQRLSLYTYADSIGKLTAEAKHGSANTYQYAYNNPLRFTDPLGLSPEDVARIYELYYQSVHDMTSRGERFPFGPINNLLYSLHHASGGRVSRDYKLCSDQVSTVRRSLRTAQQTRPFDAQWSFQDLPVHGNLHMKLKAISSDPKDPVVILDPWWRLR